MLADLVELIHDTGAEAMQSLDVASTAERLIFIVAAGTGCVPSKTINRPVAAAHQRHRAFRFHGASGDLRASLAVIREPSLNVSNKPADAAIRQLDLGRELTDLG
jgi:hypothetical protein